MRVYGLWLLLVWVVPTTALAVELDVVVDGVQGFYDAKNSIRTSFSQVVERPYRPGAQQSTPRTGVAFFQKPGKMRWDYQVPDQEYYVSDGEVLWIYEVKKKLAYRKQIKNSRLYHSMKFLFGAAKLREEFTLSLGTITEDEVSLVMVPKAGEQVFKQLILAVNARTYEIKRSILIDPSGAKSTITFSDATYGEIENPEWFSWQPGDGIEVQILDAE